MEIKPIKFLNETYYMVRDKDHLVAFDTSLDFIQKRFQNYNIAVSDDGFDLFERELREYDEGIRKTFTFPIRLTGTPFEITVYQTLLTIPMGSLISYKDLSYQCFNENKTRAVANAVAKNPLAIITPCHRVIGHDGRLTGYRGGIETKKMILIKEGHSFRNESSENPTIFKK